MHNYDIVGLNETKLDEKLNLIVPGYKIYRNDRNSPGGGVELLIRNNIQSELLNVQFEQMESISIKINTSSFEMKIVCLYLPPNKKLCKHDCKPSINCRVIVYLWAILTPDTLLGIVFLIMLQANKY